MYQKGGGARGSKLNVEFGRLSLARDKMSQDVQINWNLLDSFILIQFLKKKCLVFKDWSTGKRVANFLANMPFLYCKISTFSNQFTK